MSGSSDALITFVVSALGKAGDIIDQILKAGFEISALQMFNLDHESTEEFLDVYKGIIPNYSVNKIRIYWVSPLFTSTKKDVVNDYISGPCIAMEIRGNDIVETFRDWCGPHDPSIAKVTIQPSQNRHVCQCNTGSLSTIN